MESNVFLVSLAKRGLRLFGSRSRIVGVCVVVDAGARPIKNFSGWAGMSLCLHLGSGVAKGPPLGRARER